MNSLKRCLGLLLLPLWAWAGDAGSGHLFRLDLNQQSGDRFHVVLEPRGLGPQQRVFHFAATAPGTYQIMDIGRFVTDFKALDEAGNSLPVTRKGTNQFVLTSPEKIAKITYRVADTWDYEVEENALYRMAGSSLEVDHAFISGHAVFGFFEGQQGHPVEVALQLPPGWKVGTALKALRQHVYAADNFDHLVDSPILAGNLTEHRVEVGETSVGFYTYSKTGVATSAQIAENVSSVIQAADRFLQGFPAEEYLFLFHFEDQSEGAWEHNLSSNYVYGEKDYKRLLEQELAVTAAHEVFHMVTPLHIRSDRVNPFNFSEPQPTRHLWFFEGVTEWAAHMMRFRGGITDLDQYFAVLEEKLAIADWFSTQMSLEELSLKSYTPLGQHYFSDIYYKGAVVAGLLDLRILELSQGTKGLREVVLEMLADYGPDKPIAEEDFYRQFVLRTYPEVEAFLEDYVIKNKPLPLDPYYRKVGISYRKGKDEKGKVTHKFAKIPDPDPIQQKLFNAWRVNLSLSEQKKAEKVEAGASNHESNQDY